MSEPQYQSGKLTSTDYVIARTETMGNRVIAHCGQESDRDLILAALRQNAELLRRLGEAEEENKGLREAIAARDDYIKLLCDEITEFAGFAWTHGIQSSRVEAGKAARDRIAELDKALAHAPEDKR